MLEAGEVFVSTQCLEVTVMFKAQMRHVCEPYLHETRSHPGVIDRDMLSILKVDPKLFAGDVEFGS